MVSISLDSVIAERINIALRLGYTMRVYCWLCQVTANCFGGLPMGTEKGLCQSQLDVYLAGDHGDLLQ